MVYFLWYAGMVWCISCGMLEWCGVFLVVCWNGVVYFLWYAGMVWYISCGMLEWCGVFLVVCWNGVVYFTEYNVYHVLQVLESCVLWCGILW